MPKQASEGRGELVADWMGALLDKHGQVDIRLKNVLVAMRGTPLGLEVNGTVTVAVHMRELSDQEKRAHIATNVAAIGH